MSSTYTHMAIYFLRLEMCIMRMDLQNHRSNALKSIHMRYSVKCVLH